jgi:hypothetical protein
MLRIEKGEGESTDEKFNRMARDRMSGSKSPWWSEA